MEERATYQDMMEKQLNQWKGKMGALQAKSKDAKALGKNTHDREMDTLHSKITVAENRLRELNEARDDRWHACKAATEVSMFEIKRSLDKLLEKLM